MQNDIRTKAIVLRRTNYGESDRILNLLTEKGLISCIAKGVRKEKSKLAGGIEMFCLSEVTVHAGINNKLGILTSAKMLEAYQNITIKLDDLELGSLVLKKVEKAAEVAPEADFFNLTRQVLTALNVGVNPELVETWFWFNFAKTAGEQFNLVKDVDGNDLDSFKSYVWDSTELALREQIGGNITASEIKLMRLILSSDLKTVSRVKDIVPRLPSILYVAKSVNKI